MVSRIKRLVSLFALVTLGALAIGCGEETKGTGGGGAGGEGGAGGAGGSN